MLARHLHLDIDRSVVHCKGCVIRLLISDGAWSSELKIYRIQNGTIEFLAVQWLESALVMQRTWVQSLAGELDPTYLL